MKHYVIEEAYVGPNQDQNIDASVIKITTEPARTNSSNEICTDGWCGTTGDWSVTARGEYESEEKAKAFIDQFYDNGTRDADLDENDPSIVAMYKIGKYEPMEKEATGDFIYYSLHGSVSASTTDDEIDALVDEWEREANSQGCTLTGAHEMAIGCRDELLEEIE